MNKLTTCIAISFTALCSLVLASCSTEFTDARDYEIIARQILSDAEPYRVALDPSENSRIFVLSPVTTESGIQESSLIELSVNVRKKRFSPERERSLDYVATSLLVHGEFLYAAGNFSHRQGGRIERFELDDLNRIDSVEIRDPFFPTSMLMSRNGRKLILSNANAPVVYEIESSDLENLNRIGLDAEASFGLAEGLFGQLIVTDARTDKIQSVRAEDGKVMFQNESLIARPVAVGVSDNLDAIFVLGNKSRQIMELTLSDDGTLEPRRFIDMTASKPPSQFWPTGHVSIHELNGRESTIVAWQGKTASVHFLPTNDGPESSVIRIGEIIEDINVAGDGSRIILATEKSEVILFQIRDDRPVRNDSPSN